MSRDMAIQETDSGMFKAVWYVNRRRRTKTFSTGKLAESFIARRRIEKEQNAVFGITNDALLKDIVAQYRNEISKSDNSIARDNFILSRLSRFFTISRVFKVNQVSKGLISEYEIWRRKQGVCQRTINIDLKLLDAILNHAWKLDRIQYNPIAKYPYKKEVNHFTRFLTPEEVTAILDNAGDFKDAFYALLATGMRNSELCFLQYSDIEGRSIHIRTKQGFNPKWGRERWVSLGEDYANDSYLLRRLKGKPKDYCFPAAGQDRMKLYKALKTAVKRARLNAKGINIHLLRHTHISYMVADGVNLRSIMDNVGINDYKTLLRYSQALRGQLKNCSTFVATRHNANTPRFMAYPIEAQ